MPRYFNAIFHIICTFSLVHLAFKRPLVCRVYYNHKQLSVLCNVQGHKQASLAMENDILFQDQYFKNYFLFQCTKFN